jgi:hypothetical protein
MRRATGCGAVCPVCPTGASGRRTFCLVKGVTASFEDGSYKYVLAGPWGGLLAFSNTLVHPLS